MKKNSLALSLFTAIFLVGCGGGGGSSSSTSGSTQTSTTITGKFIDAPVEGVSYKCGVLSGITDSNGNFTCNRGDTVTFNIGNLTLGSFPAQSVITPLHLDSNLEKAYNISQLLHSLDEDSNPDNNIKLITNVNLDNVDINVNEQSFQNSLASALASIARTNYDRNEAKAKMFSYIMKNDSQNKYGLNIDLAREITELEAQMCGNSQVLNIDGVCMTVDPNIAIYNNLLQQYPPLQATTYSGIGISYYALYVSEPHNFDFSLNLNFNDSYAGRQPKLYDANLNYIKKLDGLVKIEAGVYIIKIEFTQGASRDPNPISSVSINF